MNYKTAFYSLLAVDCGVLGFYLQHDSWGAFLAIFAILLSYGLVSLLAHNKGWMVVWFVVLSIAICQSSALARGILTGTGESASTGNVVGDVWHGFQRIPENAQMAIEMARNRDLTGLADLNFKFLVLAVLIPIGIFQAIKRPVSAASRK